MSTGIYKSMMGKGYNMNKKQKQQLIKILIAGAMLICAAILSTFTKVSDIVTTVLFLIAYIFIGIETIIKAVKNILRGQVFDENFLMTIATIGAIALGEFAEANGVMLFYQVGELFESVAVDKSRKSITGLMDIRPDYANIIKDGKEVQVDPYEVKIGDIIIVKPGEKIPLDGVVMAGNASLDTAALTGEAVPRDVSEGDDIISGCINLTGALKIKVSKEFGESTVSKILDLVENASSKKANVEKFITRFARIYTPAVVIIAALLAIAPPIFLPGATFGDWIYRALVFLVISCPCALVISIPLSYFGGIGGASKCGILVKGSNYLEALARSETVVFDKTGTLTTGNFEVQEIYPENEYNDRMLMEIAAYAEAYSLHPISMSIKKSFGGELDPARIIDIKEIAGRGVEAVIKYNGETVTAHVGNEKLMSDIGIKSVPGEINTVIYIAIDMKYAGRISFKDQIKKDGKEAVLGLKKLGIERTVMLTGDKDQAGQRVAAEIGIHKAYTELLPQDKVSQIEVLLSQSTEKGTLVFVGDGINDAPVLARADIGVAMGGLGQDAAIEAADIVIMTDEPSKLVTAISIAKKTNMIAKENVWIALGIKFLVLILAAFGIASMWAAVFADVGVAVLAILNSIRALNVKEG